jgi:2-iminobutanoate/2-iminopropanoate deaminase
MKPPFEYPLRENTPRSSLPFSPAVIFKDVIFVSGQASVDDSGALVSGTFEEEFRRSLDNLERILHDAGSDLSHVIQTRNYVDRADDLPEFQRLYREYFQPPFPARTTLTNCLSGLLRYEIECIVVRKSEGAADPGSL